MKRCLLLVLMLALAGEVRAGGIQDSHALGDQQSKSTYPESEAGLNSQLQVAVEAYRSGDAERGKRLIEEFRLPAASDWIGEHLGVEQRDKIAKRYNILFENFAAALDKTLQDVVRSPGANIVATLSEGNGEKPTALLPRLKMSGTTTIKQTKLAYWHLAITIKTKEVSSWADTLTYEDGEFRFVGFGAWPFWAWEVGSEGGAPQGGYFVRQPIILSRTQPEYPVGARAVGLEGIVVLRVRLDKEGRIKSVETVSGDPQLIDAAVKAVRHWQFSPGLIGGNPAEMEATVNVVFKMS